VYQLQQQKKITVDISWVDSTTIGIHRYGSGALKKNSPQSIGRDLKGVGTKIHVALFSTKIQGACLSASNLVDMKEFSNLWGQCDWRGIEYIIADKGHDYSAVRTQITASGKTAVIPQRKGAVCPGV
jgi:hypothetical protein